MPVVEHTSADALASAETLTRFQARISAHDVLPKLALRRNSGTYPLMCYVNTVTALSLSKYFDAVPIFLARSIEHMNGRSPSSDEVPYYDLALRYIKHMAYHLRHHMDGVDFSLVEERIPVSI